MSDLRALGGILTMEDLAEYRARWEEPVSVHLDSLASTLYSVPPPGSGVVLASILNILDNFNIRPGDDIPLLYHRTVEAFKWAFATRQRSPLSLVEVQRGSALLGQELQCVACASSLMP